MDNEARDAITLPEAPAIPGLIFRYARTPDDLPGLVAVHEGSAQAESVDPLSSLESVPRSTTCATASRHHLHSILLPTR
jgi:hypothetical protein